MSSCSRGRAETRYGDVEIVSSCSRGRAETRYGDVERRGPYKSAIKRAKSGCLHESMLLIGSPGTS